VSRRRNRHGLAWSTRLNCEYHTIPATGTVRPSRSRCWRSSVSHSRSASLLAPRRPTARCPVDAHAPHAVGRLRQRVVRCCELYVFTPLPECLPSHWRHLRGVPDVAHANHTSRIGAKAYLPSHRKQQRTRLHNVYAPMVYITPFRPSRSNATGEPKVSPE